MDLFDWNRVEPEQMNALMSRQVLHTATLTIARLRLIKGAVVPMHHHVNEQVTILESGMLRFLVDGEEVIVSAGQSLVIPSQAPHAVEALEDSMAVDVFSPRREDWIRGDDAYLRK